MKKYLGILLTLVLALSLCLVMAVPVTAQETISPKLISYPDGVAQWSTLQARTGTHSVYLDAGAGGGNAGRIQLEVAPVPIADFTGASFYVWEPSGIQHGGQWPGEWDIPMPWGDPYINILLDTDGDGFFDDGLEGIGSTEGIVRPATHPASTTEQWVEMEEAYGFYTSEDTICGLESPYPTGYDVEHDAVTYDQAGTLEEWQAWFATNAPTVTVVGVQITFGWWLHDPVEGVYVDDVTINGLTYNLEKPGTGFTDVAGQVAEMPTVTSVSPASGDAGTSPTVVITGTDFIQDSTEADVVSFSGEGISVTNFTVDSATQITADITIAAGAAAGARDVSVTIGGKQGTGSGLFEVTYFLTVTAPSAIELGYMTAGDTATGFSTTPLIVDTNYSSWLVTAADLKVEPEPTGHMVSGTDFLAAKFEIGNIEGTYFDAAMGFVYTQAGPLDFFVSQAVAIDDPAGSYSITITFAATY